MVAWYARSMVTTRILVPHIPGFIGFDRPAVRSSFLAGLWSLLSGRVVAGGLYRFSIFDFFSHSVTLSFIIYGALPPFSTPRPHGLQGMTLANIRGLSPTNRAALMAELRSLEREVLVDSPPSAASSLSILLGCGPGSAGWKTLLELGGNGEASEIVRERALLLLRRCLRGAFGCGDLEEELSQPESVSAATGVTVPGGRRWIEAFYCGFASTFAARILPRKRNGGSATNAAFAEPSEDIRLLLVLLASDLLFFLESENENERKDEVERESELGETNGVILSSVSSSSALLCLSIVEGVLPDPYPELQREGCAVVRRLAGIRPMAVRAHAKVILSQLSGGPSGLLEHRHARSRCLALRTASTVLGCSSREGLRGDKIWDPAPVRDDPNGLASGGKSGVDNAGLLDLLQSEVLASWEGSPSRDRSAQVRAALLEEVGTVCRWLIPRFAETIDKSCGESQYHLSAIGSDNSGKKTWRFSIRPTSRLLTLLLMGMTDKADPIRSAASEELSSLGEAVMSELCRISESTVSPRERPKARTEHKSLVLIAPHSLDIVSILLHDASRVWLVEGKTRALETISIVLQLVCAADTDEMSARAATARNVIISAFQSQRLQMASSLCSCFREDHHALVASASSCTRELGRLNSIGSGLCSLALDSLAQITVLDNSLGENPSHPDNDGSGNVEEERMPRANPDQVGSTLCLFTCLIQGMQKGSGQWLDFEKAKEVSSTLCSKDVLDAASSAEATSHALLATCDAFVRGVPMDLYSDCHNKEMPSKSVSNILVCIAHVMGDQNVCNVFEVQSQAILDELVKCHSGTTTRYQLFDKYFRSVLHTLSISGAVDGDDSYRAIEAFDFLLRQSGGSTVAKNFDMILPIFQSRTAEDLRETSRGALKLMALLESTVSDSSFSILMQPLALALVDDVIGPSLVWAPGGKAAALRKISSAALFSLLRGKSVCATTLQKSAPHLLPILKTNASDEDDGTRELSLLSLGIIFELVPLTLSTKSMDITNWLDDSSEAVRIAACGCLGHLLRAVPSEEFSGNFIDTIVEQLVIYLDDPSEPVAEACADLLREITVRIDPLIVATKRLEHHSSISGRESPKAPH